MNNKNAHILFLTLIILFINYKQLFAQIDHYSIQKDKFIIETNNAQKIDVSDNLLLKAGIASMATGILFLADKSIRAELKQNNSQNNLLLDVGHIYGEYNYSFGLAGVLYMSQFILNDKKIANTGKVLFESLLISGVLSISIKYIFGRSRPNRNEGNTKFNWFEINNTYNSLPSGHVITAFTTSTVLSKAINNKYASILLYSLAGVTAYQRIASDNHWFSDVFLGASIGYLAGEYFSNVSEKGKIISGEYNLIPFFYQNSIGVSFNYEF